MKKFFHHPFILSLIIIIGLIFLNSQGWLKVPQDIFFRLVAAGQGITYQFSLKTNSLISFFASINKLDQENIELKKENEELLSQLVQLKEAARENEFLRQQIGLSSPEPEQLILANIISQSSSNFEKCFLINRGKKDGIKEKATVITAGNFLVGRVIEVFNSFSKVRLIIDPNSRVNVLIQESGVTGLVKSSQGLNLIVDLVPQEESIKEGQTIITSGLAGIFPPGLLIGQISQVVSIDVQVFQEAKVKPAVDFKKLEKVFVIKE
jgi:rod shape-determining protein MreC